MKRKGKKGVVCGGFGFVTKSAAAAQVLDEDHFNEVLDIPIEIKEVDIEKGVFEGHAAVFDNIDAVGDVIVPGAFNASIKRKGVRGIRLLWQHNPSKPIGVFKELREDETGLYFKAQLALGGNVPQALEAHELLQMGAVDRMSIGFNVAKRDDMEWDRDRNVRVIKKVDLWEASVVTFPANPKARVRRVKSMEDFSEEDMRGILHNVSEYTIGALGIRASAQKKLVADTVDALFADVLGEQSAAIDLSGFKTLPFTNRHAAWNRDEALLGVKTYAFDNGIPKSDIAKQTELAPSLLFATKTEQGELRAVPKALFAIAGAVAGVPGVDLPEGMDDKAKEVLKAKLDVYFEKMREEFEDEDIRTPWDDTKGVRYVSKGVAHALQDAKSIEKFLREAGFTVDEAKAMAARCHSLREAEGQTKGETARGSNPEGSVGGLGTPTKEEIERAKSIVAKYRKAQA